MDGNVYTLRPTDFLKGGANETNTTALLVLNSPIPDAEYFLRLYDSASFRVFVDGGADRVHDLLMNAQDGQDPDWAEVLRKAPPDLIHGDLDSISGTVRKRYDSIGVEISRDPDQYSTDFGKAIGKIIERVPHVKDVLVMGSIGGRVDQGIGLLHEFYREQRLRHPTLRLWLFSEAAVSSLLLTGKSKIYTPLSEGHIKRDVGILPLFGPASITTEGLEWDVQDWPTEMGRQVSTSNHIKADWITVATNREVLFTVERAIDR